MKNKTKEILKKINKGQVKVKPRIFHFVYFGLIITLLLILLGLSLYLFSFILFISDIRNFQFLPLLGLPGIKILFSSLPWLLIISVLLIVITIELLSKKFAFVSQKPIIYSLFIIIMIISLGGIRITKANFHHKMHMKAQNNQLSLGNSMYRKCKTKQYENLHIGKVKAVSDQNYQIICDNGDEIQVQVDDNTKIRNDQEINIGDTIVIIGELKDNNIMAQRIKKITRRIYSPEKSGKYRFHRSQKLL